MSRKVPFETIPTAPVDPMFILKARADADTHPEKVDLGVGVYRSGQGEYYEFPAIRKAKDVLETKRIGHDYNPTTGIPSFVRLARDFVFGESVDSSQIASIQTVAGTGANRIAAVFLSAHYQSEDRPTKAFIGIPSWGNYFPLFAHAGIATQTYEYYNSDTHEVNFSTVLHAARNAPCGSIFVLQGCCHNPSGCDLTKDQWSILGQLFNERNHFAFFDVAYQGLGAPEGAADDIWPVRHFASQGIDMLVCQSFSKNMGLYSERVGALHVVCQTPDVTMRARDVLRSLVRWEFSSAPAYGARLAEIVLEDAKLRAQWMSELAAAATRLVTNRRMLHDQLTAVLGTPGHWDHLVKDRGLFSLLGLSKDQVERLIAQYHIYLPGNGRINLAGLNDTNVSAVAKGIDRVIREGK